MKRFSKVLLKKMMLVAVLSITLMGILWMGQEYIRFNRAVLDMREKEMTARKQLLIEKIKHVHDYIHFKQSQTAKLTKSNIKSRVDEAHAIAAALWEANRKSYSAEIIKDLVRETLRTIKFNNGKGYYFAISMDGINQLSGFEPELEGRKVIDTIDTKGKLLVRDMIELIKKQKEGYYDYQWTKPGTTAKDFNKISYIKYFEPFDWLIGTGEYLDDVEHETQQEVLAMISSILYEHEGYIFAGQFDGLSLAGPEKGHNMKGLTDPNGVKIVQELISTARNGGGFVSYIMPNMYGQRSATKLSYVEEIQEWNWYVGAGMYIDDIEHQIGASRDAMSHWMMQNIFQITLVLLILIVLTVLFYIDTSTKIGHVFDSFFTFFRNAEKDGVEINTARFKYIEFRQLAEEANTMLNRLKESRQELLNSNEKFQTIFQNSPDAILISDFEEGRITDVNKGYERMSGYSREESIGKSSIDLKFWKNPEDRQKIYKTIQASGAIQNMEAPIRIKSGAIRHALLSAEPISLSGRDYLVIIVTDITELKEANQKLQASKERLSRIFNSSPMGIHTYELDTSNQLVFTGANRAADTILHTDHKPLIGKSFSEAFPDLEKTGLAEKYIHTCRHGIPWETDRVSYQNSTVNGTFQIHAFQTDPGMMATFFLDITERLKAEEEKLSLENQLRQAQKVEAIGTLAGGIAHDFNNILTPLMLHTEMAMFSLPAGNNIHPHLKEVLDSGHRARKLVRQILEFSRKGEQKRQPVKLNVICQEVIHFIRASIPRTIEIMHELPDLPYILADPVQMHQVILNLCTNAVQAMKNNRIGMIEIALAEMSYHEKSLPSLPELSPGTYIRLSVRDTGHGMNKEIKQRIFDPFFTTKEQGEGTGLGLSVVHGILISHGGGISVDSKPGEGSTFTVYLPVLPGHNHTEEQTNRIIAPTGSGTILLIDDEKTLVQAEKQMLTRLGYVVITSLNPFQGLDFFSKDPDNFDLAIIDLTMPGMTGTELARLMMAIRDNIPIILTSGNFNEEIEAEAQQLGIAKLVPKPITTQTMAEAIQEVLNNS